MKKAIALVDNILKPALQWVTGEDDWLNIFLSLYKKVGKYWESKTLIIIGPTASGKDSFLDKLRKKEIKQDYSQTRGSEEVEKYKLEWTIDGKTITTNAAPSINVGGEIDQRERFWKEACKPCDVIFYLIDAEKLKTDRDALLSRLRGDLKWLVVNASTFKKDFKLSLIVNKIDLVVQEDEDQNENIIAELINEVKEIAEKTLSVRKNHLVGVFPLSITNEYMFETYSAKILTETMEA